MRRTSLLVPVLLALVLADGARAEPPPNDNRANAQQLAALPAALDGTTAESTAEAADPKCGAAMRGTVWYRLSRTDDSTIVVSFKASGELDAVVAAFELVRTGLKAVACDLGDQQGKAGFSFQGSAGSSYYLLVGQRANSAPGAFHLDVSAPPRPANDDRAAAVKIAKLPSTVAGTTLGASTDEAPGCRPVAADVWYRIDVSKPRSFVMSLQALGDLDAMIVVVRRVRSQLERVVCYATDAKGRSRFAFDAERNSTYLILVGQLASSAPGNFR